MTDKMPGLDQRVNEIETVLADVEEKVRDFLKTNPEMLVKTLACHAALTAIVSAMSDAGTFTEEHRKTAESFVNLRIPRDGVGTRNEVIRALEEIIGIPFPDG